MTMPSAALPVIVLKRIVALPPSTEMPRVPFRHDDSARQVVGAEADLAAAGAPDEDVRAARGLDGAADHVARRASVIAMLVPALVLTVTGLRVGVPP
jgi:hypothetical protein